MESLTSLLKSQHGRLMFHVALLVGAIFVFCYSLLETDWIGTPIISFFLVAIIVANIVRLVEKSNRDFAQFLNNISHNDFASSSGSSNQGFSTRDFIDAQKTLLGKYRKLKADRSIQTEYLQMVVEHVDAALICFDNEGRIEIINRAAEQLLNKKYISSLNIVAKLNRELADAFWAIRAGETRVLKLVINNEMHQLILTATEFILQERKYKLVSLQNIKSALDEREIESWQKLIRVLTHEIMNSMTPIVSLSRYIGGVVGNEQLTQQLTDHSSEQYRDLRQSIEAIASRSQGLMEFVDSYRSLSNLPEPVFDEVKMTTLFERIELMFKEQMETQSIHFSSEVNPDTATLVVDVKLLEQILINLISNAVDAVAESADKKIQLRCEQNAQGKTKIRVRDNGHGIGKDIIDNIFTPFYTTKEKGSGIGLSLSRQLARLNNGTLAVSSSVGEGTQFILSF
ncbi:MAG: HAMP domain-containing histidine kinase [Pseudomonadales bacterium]|nr:HAMP domain-containing histidine kinase [Pseudomonadales bacterium]